MVFVWIPGWFCVVRAHYCGASGLEVGRGPGLNPSISICLVNSTIDRDSDFSLLHIFLYNLQWNTQWWYCCLSQWTFKGTRASKSQYYMGYWGGSVWAGPMNKECWAMSIRYWAGSYCIGQGHLHMGQGQCCIGQGRCCIGQDWCYMARTVY